MKSPYKKLGITLTTVTALSFMQLNAQLVQADELENSQTGGNLQSTESSKPENLTSAEETVSFEKEELSNAVFLENSISNKLDNTSASEELSSLSNEVGGTNTDSAPQPSLEVDSTKTARLDISKDEETGTTQTGSSPQASTVSPFRASPSSSNQTHYIGKDSVFGKYILASEFGVDTTGKTDSLSALQSALSYANQESAAVKLPAGSIYLSDVLKIDDQYANVKGLFGERDTLTKITFDKVQVGVNDPENNKTDNRDYAGILVENKDGFQLGRLSLTYTGSDFYRKGQSYFGRVNGIYVNDSSNVLITQTRVSGANRAGVYFGSTKADQVDPRSTTGKTYYQRVFDGELTEDDPQLPLGVNNRVEKSRLSYNRVAGILFGNQKDFTAYSNIMAYNGHNDDGGTGYGVASVAGTYNYGVTFTYNTTDHNYRKGLDIHDGNRIKILNNNSFGDRLHGIAVYNRSFVMDDVTIQGNVIHADPTFRLQTDDGSLYENPKTNKIENWGNHVYHGYGAIELQTNTQGREWKQNNSAKGKFIISGNTVSGVETYQDELNTYAINVRNHENTMDYDLVIENNNLSGTSTQYVIGILNNTQLPKGKAGLGSGDITIRNNRMNFGTISSKGYPIYIQENNAPVETRGSIAITDNNLHVTEKVDGYLGIHVFKTNAKTVTVANNNLDEHGPLAKLFAPIVRVDTVGNSKIYVLDNDLTTKNNYTMADNYYRWSRNGDWVSVTKRENATISGNTYDGVTLANLGTTIRNTTTTTQTVSQLVTEYREDDRFPLGYKEVIIEGVPQERVVVHEIVSVNDLEVSRKEISSRTLVIGTNRVILLGTGVSNEVIEKETETVPYQTIIRNDKSKPSTYKETVQKGVNGISQLTYEVVYVNGQEYKRELLSKSDTQVAQDEIVVLGSGVETTDYATEEKIVDFETEIIYDPSKTKDYEEIQQVGQNGLIQKNYKRTYFNGDLVSTELISTTTKKEAVKQIIVKGLGVVVRYDQVVTVKEVDYSQVTIEDESKPEGYREITQPGINGVVTTVYEVKFEDGEEVSRKEISRTVDPKTVDEITIIGTGKLTEYIDIVRKITPYQIIYVENPNKEKGTSEILVHGVDKIIHNSVLVTYLNGKEISRKPIEEIVEQERIDQIVEIGTRETVVTKKLRIEDVVIPYRTTYIQSEEYPVGTRIIQTPGQEGLRKDTYEQVYLDGQLEVETLTDKHIVKESIDAVVVIGTSVQTYGEQTIETPLAYQTIIRQEKTLPIGHREVFQKGSTGLHTTVYKITYVNGVEVGRDVNLALTTIIEPTDEIIIVGTGVAKTDYEVSYQEVSFDTETIEDNTLTIGQVLPIQVGKVGKKRLVYELSYFNEELLDKRLIETTQILEPTKQIVRIGTKPLTTKTIIQQDEVIAYDTQIQETLEHPIGYREILQSGKQGSRIDYYEVISDGDKELSRSFLRSENILSPVTEIILVGKGVELKEVELEEQELPFETIIIEDDTLELGKHIIDQIGNTGILQATYVLEYFNGELVKRSLSKTELKRSPITEIRRVGRKPIETLLKEEISETQELPYQVFEQEDFTKPIGYHHIVQKGQQGRLVNHYEITVSNGKEIARQLIRSEKFPAIDEYVQVGKGILETRFEVINKPLVHLKISLQNHQLAKGETRHIQTGKDGLRRVTYKVTYLNGEQIERVLFETEEVSSPTDDIIEVGIAEIKVDNIHLSPKSDSEISSTNLPVVNPIPSHSVGLPTGPSYKISSTQDREKELPATGVANNLLYPLTGISFLSLLAKVGSKRKRR